jgi:hypothetical protein
VPSGALTTALLGRQIVTHPVHSTPYPQAPIGCTLSPRENACSLLWMLQLRYHPKALGLSMIEEIYRAGAILADISTVSSSLIEPRCHLFLLDLQFSFS